MLKEMNTYHVSIFKAQMKWWKKNYYLNLNRRKIALSCSKKLSALWREITSKNGGDFYCLICIYSFRTKSKIKSQKELCEKKCFCAAVMPSKNTKILEFNQYQKFDKTLLM